MFKVIVVLLIAVGGIWFYGFNGSEVVSEMVNKFQKPKYTLSDYEMKLKGTFSGDKKGFIFVNIDKKGYFRGTGTSVASSFTLFGSVDIDGNIKAKTLIVGTSSPIASAIFTGKIDLDNKKVSGTWANKKAKISGKWTATPR